VVKFSQDAHPVSNLRRQAHELVGQARRTGRPILITQRGRGAAVLVSVEEWERLEEQNELLKAVVHGERDFEEGRVVDEAEALARLRRAAGGSAP